MTESRINELAGKLFDDAFSAELEDFEAALREVWNEAVEEILRGLSSENDSMQLRAIIVSVEALKLPEGKNG